MSNEDDQFELEVPIFIELKPSSFANDLGVFCTMPLHSDLHLGHFKGKTRKVMSQCADPNYVWTILSSRQVPLFYIDASDPKDSNWLRFIRTTSDASKYNTICMQQNQQINYFTYKEVQLGEELLTYLPGKKKKSRKNVQSKTYRLADIAPEISSDNLKKSSNSPSSYRSNIPSDSPSITHTAISPQPEPPLSHQQKHEITETPVNEHDYKHSTDLDTHLNDNNNNINNSQLRSNTTFVNELTKSPQIKEFQAGNDLIKTEKYFEIYRNDLNFIEVGCVLNEILDKIEITKNNLIKREQNEEKQEEEKKEVNNLLLTNQDKKDQKEAKTSNLEADNEDVDDEEDELEEEEEEVTTRKSANSSPTPSSQENAPAAKTYTCQLCKKQFDQRFELSKHQCIELSLKLLKKKKELRKKKWREAHWKRKIDLSYIETTSLTLLAQNVADNLSFCIDGTIEDLRAYSREVKDYLNTEIGEESQQNAALKGLGLLDKCYSSSKHSLESVLQRKADSYFTDCVYNEPATTSASSTTSFQCKNCRTKKSSLNDLLQHQRECHGQDLKTTYDFYERQTSTAAYKDENYVPLLSSDLYSTSPIGYLATDPFSYIINMYWDQKLPKKCEKCNLVMSRPKYRKHVLMCMDSYDGDSFMNRNNQEINEVEDVGDEDDESMIVDEERSGGRSEVQVKEELDEDRVDREVCCKLVVGYLIDEVEKSFIKVEKEKKKMNEKETKKKEQQRRDEAIKEIESGVVEKEKEIKKEKLIETSKRNKRPLNQDSDVVEVKKIGKIQPQSNSLELEATVSTSIRSSPRIRRSNQKPPEESSSKQSSDSETDTKTRLSRQNANLVTVRSVGNRKIHTCVKCGLEFTSANSVFRHQEKSCLRVRVIHLKGKETASTKNKCPICSCLFYSTHRLSIHIYKHHKNLLGSASQPPSAEARRLNEIQLKRLEDEDDEEAETDESHEEAGMIDEVAG